MRRALATGLTLGLLSSFLFAVVVGVMLATGTVSFPVAAVLVVVVNVVILLVSPTINDLVYGWLYDLEWVALEEFGERSPASAEVVEAVTDEYGYDTPKLGVIPDRNPTAFTYGSARFNARVVVTEGTFEFLEDEELASVVAHELGHVTSRDFIIMTMANTIVQLLYLVAVYGIRFAQAGRASSNQRGNAAGALYAVAALSYVLYFLSEYVVLYLSRVREYAADGFAGEWADPDDLSVALVKIAYGIVATPESTELARATQNVNIVSVEGAKEKGILYANADESLDASLLRRAFLFDLYSPWAQLLELNSTHPLTGKRIRALSRMPGAELFDFAAIRAAEDVDRGRLYREFGRDVAALGLPGLAAVGFPLAYLGLGLAGVLAIDWLVLAGGWALAVALAVAARTAYTYTRGRWDDATVLELLGDVYASPVDGRRARLEGELIGRGQAGYRFSEDLMFRDATGLMYLQYESWLPLFGNLLFAWRDVPELVGEDVTVEGWFLRGVSPWVALRHLHHGEETGDSYVHLSGYVLAALLVVLGVLLLGASVVV